jgi:hypothetical protein
MCLEQRHHQHLVSFLQSAALCFNERQLKQSPSTLDNSELSAPSAVGECPSLAWASPVEYVENGQFASLGLAGGVAHHPDESPQEQGVALGI